MRRDLSDVERNAAAEGLLCCLSVMQKEAVIRKSLGLSLAKIASEFGVTRQAIKKRLWRARRRLRAKMTEGQRDWFADSSPGAPRMATLEDFPCSGAA